MLKKKIILVILTLCFSLTCYAKASGFKETEKVKYGVDTLHTYEHTQSGAHVTWIENKDQKRSFILGVKTPTEDSTGVNHIIEHTLFTGSKAYPSSSLFFDASEAYPNIYMNALTSADMTMFPFATPYMSCYKELLKVYLDSIFEPTMLLQPNGFYEESFNYNPETGGLGGVVYNEMKGAYSSNDRKIYRAIREELYKNTFYAYDSGGDPNEIPKLSYEHFLETYKKYYVPSNMQIIFYGDLPIDEMLETLESYVKNYAKVEPPITLDVQLSPISSYNKLSVLAGKDQVSLVKACRLEKKLSASELQQMNLWFDAYVLNPRSDFQQKLRQAGFSKMKLFKDDDLPYPIYTFIIQDVDADKIKVQEDILDWMIEGLVQNTEKNTLLEKDSLSKAHLRELLRDVSINRGIEISQSILDGWAHNRETKQYYTNKEELLQKESLKEEQIKSLLQNASWVTLELWPKEETSYDPLGFQEVTKKDWSAILKNMANWQEQENQALLPEIDLENFVIEPSYVPSVKVNKDYTSMVTQTEKGLARSQLYFNTAHVPQEELPYMFLYTYLLEESAREEVPFRGVLGTQCIALGEEESYDPLLKISILTSEKEKNHGEILEKARKRLLSKDSKWYEHKLQQFEWDFKEGWEENMLGALTSLSRGSQEGYKRYLYEMGYPLYELCKTLKTDEQKEWIKKVKEVDSYIFNKEGLTLATAADVSYRNPYEKSLLKVLENEPEFEIKRPGYQFEKQPSNSLVLTKAQVDYIYREQTLDEDSLDGEDYLTMSYLTKHYLNPEIRRKLGAYGAGGRAHFPDTLSLYTYRDPNYTASLDVMAGIPDYLEKSIDEEVLKRSKADALSSVHNHLGLLGNSLEQSSELEEFILKGIPFDKIKVLQQEIIKADANCIQEKAIKYKDLIKKASTAIATCKYPEIVSHQYKIYQF